MEGLDDAGVQIGRIELEPTPQEIPPGGAAAFVARLPGNPNIHTFHVEAIGQ